MSSANQDECAGNPDSPQRQRDHTICLSNSDLDDEMNLEPDRSFLKYRERDTPLLLHDRVFLDPLGQEMHFHRPDEQLAPADVLKAALAIVAQN